MKPFIALASIAVLGVALVGCDYTPSSDEAQRVEQERILQEGNAQTGMPAIKNFRERKLLKQIIEMRDQDGLVLQVLTGPTRLTVGGQGAGQVFKVPAMFVLRPSLHIVTLQQAGHCQVEVGCGRARCQLDRTFEEWYAGCGLAYFSQDIAVVVEGRR